MLTHNTRSPRPENAWGFRKSTAGSPGDAKVTCPDNVAAHHVTTSCGELGDEGPSVGVFRLAVLCFYLKKKKKNVFEGLQRNA